jgi:aminoglycoside 3-N-acetyltransferase
MVNIPTESIDNGLIRQELETLGLPSGATVVVHSSLSAFGAIRGGAQSIVEALQHCVGPSGTLVVPTFTPQVSDPHPQPSSFDDPQIIGDRQSVPLFHDHLPTPMGAVPNAVLAHPERLRGRHPQASVAAIGTKAREITADQPFIYALGKDSPFEKMYRLGAYILLLGVGHNRNSFLHYAESLVPHHRTKLRRFPYMIGNERVWVEVPDVGDDNGKYFPQIGSEAEAAGLIRSTMIGSARCELMECVPFVDFARSRLEALLVGNL